MVSASSLLKHEAERSHPRVVIETLKASEPHTRPGTPQGALEVRSG